MVKVVENGERICTVTLDGSESSVVFQNDYKYFAVKNESDADVYVSLNRDIVEGADGVMTIGSKESALFAHMKPNVNMFFVKGKGKIQVFASSNAINPFKSAPASDGGGVQASGNPVQINGLQGGVPFSEITVRGKNLMSFPYYDGNSKTQNGITFTVNADGTVTANGTSTDIAYFYIAMYAKIVKKGVRYAISGCPEGANADTYRIFINERKSDGTSNGIFIADFNDNKSFTVSDNCDSIHIAIQIRSGVTVDNLVFRPQLELGSTPTEYEPPITGRELQVNVCGKNLMKPNKSTVTLNGITATMNDDGSVTLNGTATANTYIFMWNILYAHNMGVGKIAVNAIDGQSISTYFMGIDRREGSSYIDRVAQSITNNGIGEITQEDVENGRNFTVWVRVAEGCTCNNLIIYPQLELGDTATAYEPYHGSTTTITPDSNPYVIPNDIRQQDGYNVVSVSEGEISVTGVQKNAAIKRIWDDMSMDLLFDGVTSANNPAVIDLANYNMIRIDVGGNFEGTSYFNCGSTYFSKSTLDFAVTSYGYVAIPLSNQAVIISISKSGTEYSLSFSGFNEKQLVEVIKIFGIK